MISPEEEHRQELKLKKIIDECTARSFEERRHLVSELCDELSKLVDGTVVICVSYADKAITSSTIKGLMEEATVIMELEEMIAERKPKITSEMIRLTNF